MGIELNDSVKQLRQYVTNVNGGRTKFNNETFSLLCEPVERHVSSTGLSAVDFKALVKALTKTDGEKGILKSSNLQRVCRILIPNHRPDVQVVETFLVWFMTYWKKMPRYAAKTFFMWFIAALNHELIQPDDINWCYDSFFTFFDVKSLSIQVCKFLELLTTPELITIYRTQYLWKQFGKANMKGPITHLLSLYKTLRPDKVPMQVPVINFGFLGSSGERTMTDRLELAAERAELADANPGTHSFKSIRWAIRPKKNSKKRAIILPTINYNVNVATIDQGKQLLDCQTIKDVALNILSAKTPAQILSLVSCRESLFFMRFQGNEDIKYRFDYNLLHVLSYVKKLFYDPLYEEDISELLNCLISKQEIDQCGSPVVSKFVQEFLLCIQHPTFLAQILKLLEKPYFTTLQGLEVDFLEPLELFFYSSDNKHKMLIIESLWNMVYYLFFIISKKRFEMMDCQPHEALLSILAVIEKMYNYIISTRGVFELGPIAYIAIEHYIRLFEEEEMHSLENELFSIAPSALLLACIITGPASLLERSSVLILKYYARAKALSSSALREPMVRARVRGLEDVRECIYEIISHPEDMQSTSVFKRVLNYESVPVLSKSVMEKTPILRYFGILPEKLTSEAISGFEWTVEDVLLFYANNYPAFAEMLMVNLQQSDPEGTSSTSTT